MAKISEERLLMDKHPQKYDIHIAEDGRWYHEGGEIKRAGLVKLFASVLSYENAQYWLRTPAEEGIISVADAPFVITGCDITGSGQSQIVHCEDNLGRKWVLGNEHPLEVRPGPSAGEPRPYIHLDKGLVARLGRPVFYELANNAELDETGRAGIWSTGQWFTLEPPMVCA